MFASVLLGASSDFNRAKAKPHATTTRATLRSGDV
jgi:hypothetical protein